MSRKRKAVATGVALAGVAGVVGWVVNDGRATGDGGPAATGVSTSTAPVSRTTVAERQPVGGTLGYADTYRVTASGGGTLTRLPAIGQIIDRGRTAYEVDGIPVILMYGSRPVWRDFESGMTNGADVRQLETNLRAMGYGDGLTVDRHFSSATYRAVRDWQRDAHLPVTGTVPLGQVVFVPDAVRIGAHDLKVGALVQSNALVEHGTSDQRAVTVQLQPAQLPRIHVGDPVVVTLPDGTTRTGKVSVVGAVVTPSSDTPDGGQGAPGSGANQATAPITIKVAGAIRGFLDQAQVQVAITAAAHKNVLAVPITALHVLPGGKYEVIVVDGGAERHMEITTGLFDESTGLAEVSAPGLAEGQQVEVPGDGS